MAPMLKVIGKGCKEGGYIRVVTIKKTMKNMVGRMIYSESEYRTAASKGIRGVHWYDGPTFLVGPITQVLIQSSETAQGGSLPGVFIIENMDVVLYVIL